MTISSLGWPPWQQVPLKQFRVIVHLLRQHSCRIMVFLACFGDCLAYA